MKNYSIFSPDYRPGLLPSDKIDRPFYYRYSSVFKNYSVERLLKNGSTKVYKIFKTENGARNHAASKNLGLKQK